MPRLYGFELMMAPYTIAHLKLGMTLQETGVQSLRQRLGVYLTNTLEEGSLRQPDLFSYGLAEVVSKEAEEAAEIKHDRPIMVIIGNPPYRGISSNETIFANSLIDKYKVEPGGKQKLQERKHWLNDDYVKFIAFAEDMIEKNGDGILAMITNHGYIDNPTFRGMRWHLAKTFDQIYILDLHGNSNKKETAPDGSKDENVFDIQQGVAIIIAVKKKAKGSDNLAIVKHAELYGLRKKKFEELEKFPEWQPVDLNNKFLFFAPKNSEGQSQYDSYIKIDELFRINVTGIVTARDSVVIDTSKQALSKRMKRFADLSYSDDETRSWLFPTKKAGKYMPGDSRGWKLPEARKAVAQQIISENIKTVNYRPFDNRSIYYTPDMVDWGRFDVMSNMLAGNNLGLVTTRLQKDNPGGYISNSMITHKVFNSYDSNSIFPLYIFHDDGTRTPNFRPEVLKEFTKKLTKPYEPENILDYIYAVLYSPQYRNKYKVFLKTDFPRVPAPRNDAQLRKLSALGEQLRDLHLMTSKKLNDYETTYSEAGSNEVEKIGYKDNKVWINAKQYFGNVPEEAWNFYIGGYQPAQKWLKDRKGRELNSDDIAHYQKIIKVLIETDRLMKEIDQVI